jgi:hypothetical protein
MIKAFQLCHPQSVRLLTHKEFDSENVECKTISCGTVKFDDNLRIDLSEANDFFPTYAAWNSLLFETSVILTIWEHADQLIGDDHVAIMHSDNTIHFDADETWERISNHLEDDSDRAVGLIAQSSFSRIWKEWEIPKSFPLSPCVDPMSIHAFDNEIFVWDYIKKYDPSIYAWAMETQPRMIYSHQFACSRKVFDLLGNYLHKIVKNLKLSDTGFWTPHVFERLIALFLAKQSDPILTTAFWHHGSSGTYGPGACSLYGPRPLKYYKINARHAS